jgi:glycosyltransferase involved in cell wall biosynthesis
LAFDCAAARDWVKPNSNGWLVDENNPDGFAAQAVSVMRQPELFDRVTQTTRQQVVHLDWNQIAEQVEGVFLNAIRMR